MNIVSAIILMAALLMIVAGMFCLVRTYNLIRIIIAIEIAMKAITLLLVVAGAVNGNMALSQTFVITMIVLEVIVAVVAAGIAISLYHKNGNVDIRELTNLKG